MWSRADLKKKGKAAFYRNRWRSVLVSLVMAILFGGGTYMNFQTDQISYTNSQDVTQTITEDEEFQEAVSEEEVAEDIDRLAESGAIIALVAIFFIVFVVVFIVSMAIFMVFDVLLICPFEVGCKRFQVQNLTVSAEVKEIAYAFDHEYRNIIKVMFFRELYIILWTLLLIIPGIVKSYEYRMVAYLLAEEPTMSKEAAFAISKQMMHGQKWKAFVLDLSFLGWILLDLFTFGLLGIFYLNPYRDMTNAALYVELKRNYQTKLNEG